MYELLSGGGLNGNFTEKSLFRGMFPISVCFRGIIQFRVFAGLLGVAIHTYQMWLCAFLDEHKSLLYFSHENTLKIYIFCKLNTVNLDLGFHYTLNNSLRWQ